MSDARPEAYLNFLLEVLQATDESDSDKRVVYPLLQANLDKLDDTLIQVLRTWATYILPKIEPNKVQRIVTTIYNFSNLIQEFPLGSKAVNQEMAIAGYEIALTVWTHEAFPENWARIQNNLGIAYNDRIRGERADNLEVAIALYNAALKIYTREAFPQDWARTQTNLGNAYCNRIRGQKADNLEMAIALYNAALKIYTREVFPENWATTQNNLGTAYSDRIQGERADNLERAITSFSAALEVRTREAFPQDWAGTQTNLGNAYANRIRGDRADNLELAIESFKAVLEVRTREAFPYEWATTQNNLGNAYCNRIRGERADNLERAITSYNAALEVYTREAFPYEWTTIQNNLAITYRNRIRGEQAYNLEWAIASYNAALEFYTREAFPYDWARTQNNLGEAYRNRIRGQRADNLEWAIASYNAALEVLTCEAFPQDWATTQNNLGIAYRDLGQIAEAINSFRLALAIRTPTALPLDCLQTGRNLGETAFQAELWSDAFVGYDAAIQSVEQLREWSTSQVRRQELLQYEIEVSTQIVRTCVNVQQIEKAIEYVDRSKARNLVKLFTYPNLNPKDKKVSEFLRELEYRTGEISTKSLVEISPLSANLKSEGSVPSKVSAEQHYQQQEISAQRQLPEKAELNSAGDTLSNVESEYLRQAVDELQPQAEQILELIKPIDTSSYQFTQTVRPISFTEIRDLLDNHTAIILWYITSERFFTFVITRQSPPYVWQSSADDLAELEQWADDYLNDYNAIKREKNLQWQTQLASRLKQLSAILHLDEILSHVPQECEQLILIPHRCLHLFPLHALPLVGQASRLSIESRQDACTTNGYYLLDKFPVGIRYAPSCQLLQQVQQRNYLTPEIPYLFAIQNPTRDLRYTDIEVETIKRAFKPNTHILEKEKATKQAFTQAQSILYNAHYAHLSCHGAFNFESPLRSALMLATSVIPTANCPKDADSCRESTPATKTRYQSWYDNHSIDTEQCLTLQEIFENIDLPQCHLVTLSACETGLTDFNSLTDEYVGFASGFLYAGSLCVVCSLWNVDDFATAFLMIKFYENLRTQWKNTDISRANYPTVAKALNEAQSWLRQVTKTELQTWMKQQLNLDNNRIQDINLRLRLFDEQPFNQPEYWAAFCAIGQ
ncbi:MAG: hypothetical protein Fur006_48010 [Coleofasciculaceae cyanobacterium]